MKVLAVIWSFLTSKDYRGMENEERKVK